MKKFLVILLSLMLLVSFSLSVGCKKAETPPPTPEKPAVEAPAPAPTPEQAPAEKPAEAPTPAPEKPAKK
jgi:hypothetical protein